VDPKLVGFVIGLIPTLASVGVAVRQTREARKLATLNSDLQAELHERVARIDRQLNAEDLVARYSQPLAAAAMDLQSRCWNIVNLAFFEKFGPPHPRFADAQMTTLFRFAQYFGWTEILRAEIQFLSFPENADTQAVADLQSKIANRLATSAQDEPLMLWVDEQRAIGERMIVEERGKVSCMGYAAFCDAYDSRFRSMFERVFEDVAAPESKPRYREVQHSLADLVGTLDKQHVRYPETALGHA
jgi:hypothetical protein